MTFEEVRTLEEPYRFSGIAGVAWICRSKIARCFVSDFRWFTQPIRIDDVVSSRRMGIIKKSH